ncbi:MAG: zinc ribbon domain-containing protein [Candidatus Limnocylindrales bacterium]
MNTGFGFCPQCGTPRIAADQRFCAACGNDLSALVAAPPAPAVAAAPAAPVVVPPPAAPVSPTQAAPQPAASVPSQPPTPPAWAAAPAQSYPAGYPAPGAPGVPAAPAAPAAPIATVAGIQITPKLAVIGAIALAVVIGAAYLFMNMNSKPGSLTFSPSTISCSSPVAFTVTARLPASLKSTDSISIWLDGKSAGSSPIGESGSDVKQQPDGSWLTVSTTPASEMQSTCASGVGPSGFSVATPGTHTMQIRDATGKVLAEGSYTVTP